MGLSKNSLLQRQPDPWRVLELNELLIISRPHSQLLRPRRPHHHSQRYRTMVERESFCLPLNASNCSWAFNLNWTFLSLCSLLAGWTRSTEEMQGVGNGNNKSHKSTQPQEKRIKAFGFSTYFGLHSSSSGVIINLKNFFLERIRLLSCLWRPTDCLFLPSVFFWGQQQYSLLDGVSEYAASSFLYLCI